MGAFGYNVNPVMRDGHIDTRAQKLGVGRWEDAMEAARLLSGQLKRGSLRYAKVQVHDADSGRLMAEFAHGDRLHDHRNR